MGDVELALLADLQLPGSRIPTDTGWTARRASILQADPIDGQRSDLRRDDDPEGGEPVQVVDHDRARLTWSGAPPVRRVAEVVPAEITRLSPSRQIVNLRQNLSGWLRLSGLGAAGIKVVLELAEHLGPDGDITTEHLDSHAAELERHIPFRQIDSVISGGPGRDVFEPRHAVHGFRYVRVDGYHHRSVSTGAAIARILGIRPFPDRVPGYREVRINPVPGGGLTEARGEYRSRSGTIGVAWTNEGRFELEVTLPQGVEATVVLPSGREHRVIGGAHRLTD